MNKIWFIVFLVLITCGFAAIGLLTGFFEARQFTDYPNDYAIVFDAGSSGTRMYIYKWKAGFSAARGDNLVIKEDYSCITDDRGIDKITSKDGLVQAFQNCMANADSRIPELRKSRTYIFLASTAGMRLLELRNATISETVLNYARQYFSTTKYIYKSADQVKVLSGREESTNAWIAANYFLNKFKPNADPYENYGILDLGGASTQLAFTPKTDNMLNTAFFDQLRIYGVNYQPYSYSYLCRGSNQANLLYRAYLINKNGFQKIIDASCYPRNVNVSTSARDLIDSPCTNGLFFGTSVNFTIAPSRLNNTDVYTLVGTSDSAKCQQEVQDMLPKTPCSYSNCGYDNVYQPSLEDKKFYAINGNFYAFNNTQALVSMKLQNDWNGYVNATSFLCSKSINELNTLNTNTRSGITNSNLINMCFSSNYAIQVMRSYGFRDLNNVQIVSAINGYTVGWSLGFLINQLNRDDFLPYEVPPRMVPIQYFIPFVIIASLLSLALVALFFLFGCGGHRYFRNKKTNSIL